MAPAALVVVITVALATIVALSVTVLLLVLRLRALAATLRRLEAALGPALVELTAEAEAAQRELERVSREAGERATRRG